MSAKSDQNHCPYSDAVLALLLDGDSDTQLIQETGWQRDVSAADLASHRRECPICNSAIESARRLDGLLAASTDLCIDEELASRLLEKTQAIASTVEEPVLATEETGIPRRRLKTQLVGLGLLALGFTAGGLFWQSGEGIGQSNRATEDILLSDQLPPAKYRSSTLEPGMIRVPDASLTRPRRRTERLEMAPRQQLAVLRLTDRLTGSAEFLLELGEHLPVTFLQRLGLGLSSSLSEIRSQTARSLLRSENPEARRLTLASLSAWIDSPALALLLAEARQQTSLRMFLARRIAREFEDELLQRAAVRIGGREIDRQLLLLVADRPASADRIARELGSLQVRPEREQLLLDLWEADQRKNDNVDELQRARRWFSGLPSSSSQALMEEFHRSRRADRRRRALLAIGVCRDPLLSDELRLIVDGSRHEESELAAFALGQLPAGSDELLQELDWSRRPHLLLAAIACRQDARLARSLARLKLSEAEHQFLIAGDFTPEQLAIAAALFRQQGDLAGL